MNSSDSLRIREECDGSLLRLTLNRPPANLMDRQMVDAIRGAFEMLLGRTELRTVLFDHEGDHFSYGASVKEHRKEEVDRMLPEFHMAFREMFASGKVLLAAVHGRCLGGGFELAAFCHRVFAAESACFGNPEIKLGVFAPVASVVLPHRVRQPVVDDLLLTGRVMPAAAALQCGVIDEIATDPTATALAWHQLHLQPLSGVALQHAVRASRHRLGRELVTSLANLEDRYLNPLMDTSDANEGIEAFLQKRSPTWSHR